MSGKKRGSLDDFMKDTFSPEFLAEADIEYEKAKAEGDEMIDLGKLDGNNIYCGKCRNMQIRYTLMYELPVATCKASYTEKCNSLKMYRVNDKCVEKNRHNDCPDFEKKPWWRRWF